MAANLTSLVMQFLTPDVIEKIASFLGLDKAATEKAAGGAVPALLAGLSDLVATPAGANQVSKLVSQQQVGPPTDLLQSAGPQGLAETGSSMLAGLFGGRTVDALAQAVGKSAGTGESGGKSLLSVLGPIVLGALGQQQRSAGLDANGLASLLRSQKDQITAAIPSGLADQLGAAGLIDKAEEGLRSGVTAASAGASRVEGAAGRADTSSRQTASAMPGRSQWPYWLAGVIVLAGLGWYVMQRQDEENVAEAPVQQTQPAGGTVGMAPASLTVDGVNLASELGSSVDALKSALPGITDAAGAQAAVPKINQVTAQLDDLRTRAAKLSPEGRSVLVKLVAAVKPQIEQMCDNVMATPGAPVAKPAIDGLRAKMDSLTQV